MNIIKNPITQVVVALFVALVGGLTILRLLDLVTTDIAVSVGLKVGAVLGVVLIVSLVISGMLPKQSSKK